MWHSAPRIAWDCRCERGESPVWLPDAGTLLFVDMGQGRILSFDHQSGQGGGMDVGGAPGFILPTTDGRLLLGDGRDLSLFDLDGSVSIEAKINTSPHNQVNDATVDHLGRLWFSMSDVEEARPSGGLFRYHDERMIHMIYNMSASCGPALSEDSRTLYHVNAAERSIHRYQVRSAGSLTHGELFLRFEESEGTPHGVTLDAEDCLWVALSGGGAVRRYAPDGQLLLQVDIPCSQVSKVAFGGPDLKTAYVTTARAGVGAAALSTQPNAGALFAFDSPVAGRTIPSVKLGGGDLGLIEDDDH